MWHVKTATHDYISGEDSEILSVEMFDDKHIAFLLAGGWAAQTSYMYNAVIIETGDSFIVEAVEWSKTYSVQEPRG